MRAYRAKVRTQEEADRMAASLMEEEEQAKQKVLLKVRISIYLSFVGAELTMLLFIVLVLTIPCGRILAY